MDVDEDERETESSSAPPATCTSAPRQEVSRAEKTRDRKSRSDAAESAGSAPHSSSSSSAAPSKPRSSRTPCAYGKDCYRWGSLIGRKAFLALMRLLYGKEEREDEEHLNQGQTLRPGALRGSAEFPT